MGKKRELGGNFVDRLKSNYGIEFEDPDMEKKVEGALEVLSDLKEKHPEIDLNYIVTGKHSDARMKADMYNFHDSEVNMENSNHYSNSVVVTCPLSEKVEMLKDQNEVIRDLVNMVSELKLKGGGS